LSRIIRHVFYRTEVFIQEIQHVFSAFIDRPNAMAGLIKEEMLVFFRSPQKIEQALERGRASLTVRL